MYPASSQPSFGTSLAGPARAAFIRRVYLLMTGAVATSAAAAAFASLAGAETSSIVMRNGTHIPPLIALFLEHPFLGLILMLGGTFGAGLVVRKPGVNVAALFALSGVIGLVMAPAIFFAQLKGAAGTALTTQPVLHAFGLAVTGFAGLSSYALVSRRDFSSIGGFLSMGLFVVLGASILNIFFGGSALSLAIASVTVMLFGGYVLYDTSRLLQAGEDEPVEVALSLYLDFLNLFMALLRIFTGGRRDD
jgi:modulator of FtsH protease